MASRVQAEWAYILLYAFILSLCKSTSVSHNQRYGEYSFGKSMTRQQLPPYYSLTAKLSACPKLEKITPVLHKDAFKPYWQPWLSLKQSCSLELKSAGGVKYIIVKINNSRSQGLHQNTCYFDRDVDSFEIYCI